MSAGAGAPLTSSSANVDAILKQVQDLSRAVTAAQAAKAKASKPDSVRLIDRLKEAINLEGSTCQEGFVPCDPDEMAKKGLACPYDEGLETGNTTVPPSVTADGNICILKASMSKALSKVKFPATASLDDKLSTLAGELMRLMTLRPEYTDLAKAAALEADHPNIGPLIADMTGEDVALGLALAEVLIMDRQNIPATDDDRTNLRRIMFGTPSPFGNKTPQENFLDKVLVGDQLLGTFRRVSADLTGIEQASLARFVYLMHDTNPSFVHTVIRVVCAKKMADKGEFSAAMAPLHAALGTALKLMEVESIVNAAMLVRSSIRFCYGVARTLLELIREMQPPASLSLLQSDGTNYAVKNTAAVATAIEKNAREMDKARRAKASA
jgi:hypothetical protein